MVPLNCKQSYHCLDKTAHAKFIKCFPRCFCFLNLHIDLQINIKTIVWQSLAILSAVGLGPYETFLMLNSA